MNRSTQEINARHLVNAHIQLAKTFALSYIENEVHRIMRPNPNIDSFEMGKGKAAFYDNKGYLIRMQNDLFPNFFEFINDYEICLKITHEELVIERK